MIWISKLREQPMPRTVKFYTNSIATSQNTTYTPKIKGNRELQAFVKAYTSSDVRKFDALDLSKVEISPEVLKQLQEWHPLCKIKLKKTGSFESFKKACDGEYAISDIKFTLSITELEDFLTLCEVSGNDLFVPPTRLDLSGTPFTEPQFRRLLAILENNSAIQHLNLNNCGIQDHYFADKAKPHKPTTAFKHLHSLKLSNNKLKHQHVVYMAKALSELDLSGNLLSRSTYLTFVDACLKQSGAKLKRLYLQNTGDSSAPFLNLWSSQSESLAKTLVELDLRGSNPSLGGIETLHHMKALRRLALSDLTHLEGSNYSNSKSSLLDSILRIERLEDLTLQRCKLSTIGLNKVFATDGIRKLDLSDNPSLFTVKVSGSSANIASVPPLVWKSNAKLRALVLNGSTVRDRELHNIAEHFQGLRTLGIAGSNISFNALQSALGHLTELKSLDLTDAGMTGANLANLSSPRKRRNFTPDHLPNPLKSLIDAFNQRDSLKKLFLSETFLGSRIHLKEFLLALNHVTTVNGLPKARYLKNLEQIIAENAKKNQSSQSRTNLAIKPEIPADTSVETVVVHPSSTSTQPPAVKQSSSIRSLESDAGSSEPQNSDFVDSMKVETSSEGEKHSEESSRRLFALIKSAGNIELFNQAKQILVPKNTSVSQRGLFARHVPPLNLSSVPESSQEGRTPNSK